MKTGQRVKITGCNIDQLPLLGKQGTIATLGGQPYKVKGRESNVVYVTMPDKLIHCFHAHNVKVLA